ncbi:hypothetical protein [Paenibacillus campi]|uniref:hypothetical protein n=1 Tax=Paenibacillus campi TaxID=3106031 RepID=UPI002AFFB68C|nr:hypothetical protein [Paenibacillus sp. SGZ-1014]
MTLSKNGFIFIRLLAEAVLSYFLFINDFKFLSILLIVAMISDLSFLVVRKQASQQEYVATGHLSYLFTLAVLVVLFLLNQSNLINSEQALTGGILLTVLVFLIVYLFKQVRSKTN